MLKRPSTRSEICACIFMTLYKGSNRFIPVPARGHPVQGPGRLRCELMCANLCGPSCEPCPRSVGAMRCKPAHLHCKVCKANTQSSHASLCTEEIKVMIMVLMLYIMGSMQNVHKVYGSALNPRTSKRMAIRMTAYAHKG